MQSSLADLDGVTVAARALGWDSSNADEWALSRGDLPLLVNQVGTLTITYVDALDYTQFVVNGIPVDPASIEPVDYSGEVLVADGWEKVPRDHAGKWTSGPAGSGQKPAAGWAPGTAGVVQKHLAGIATMQELQDHLAATGYKGSTLVLLTAMENLSAGKVISQTQEAALKEIGVDLTLAGISTETDHSTPPADVLAPAPALTPGQKAALTKKMNKAAAAKHQAILDELSAGNIGSTEALEQLMAITGNQADALAILAKHNAPPPVPTDPHVQSVLDQSLANEALKGYVNSVAGGSHAVIPNDFTLTHASDGQLDDYLVQQMSKKSYDALGGKDRRETAIAIAHQHADDIVALAALDVYPNADLLLAVQARRAILRESGERKPTGGPSDPGTRVFYGEAAILAMTRDKQIAIINHHAAGYPPTELAGMDDQFIAARAVKADADYKQVIGELALATPAVNMADIPHSYLSALAVKNGYSVGLPKKVSTVVTAAPVAVGKPANWSSMTPGKKAAWTKKNKAANPPIPVPHPAEWDSMGPGKKAAWTKKYNAGLLGVYAPAAAGGVKAKAGGPLGEHSVMSGLSSHEQKFMNAKAVDAMDVNFDYQKHTARVTAFQEKLTSTEETVWSDYTGSGYKSMNRCAKYGTGCGGAMLNKLDIMQQSILKHGTPAPKVLFRGKKAGPLADLDFKVGTEFVEPGFGSWAGTVETPKSFAGTAYEGTTKNVFYRLKDTQGMRSAPGTNSEHETITPRGVKYRVTGIQDFVHHGHVRRIMDVELVSTPFG